MLCLSHSRDEAPALHAVVPSIRWQVAGSTEAQKVVQQVGTQEHTTARLHACAHEDTVHEDQCPRDVFAPADASGVVAEPTTLQAASVAPRSACSTLRQRCGSQQALAQPAAPPDCRQYRTPRLWRKSADEPYGLTFKPVCPSVQHVNENCTNTCMSSRIGCWRIGVGVSKNVLDGAPLILGGTGTV